MSWRRSLLRAGVVALVAGTLAALTPAASAAPAPTSSAPLAAGPGSDDAGSSDRPVSVLVTRFEPRTVTPGATITVTGTLVNTGDRPVTGLAIRLQRGEVRSTREELDAAVRQTDPATTVVPTFSDVRGSLKAGATLSFSYRVTAAALHLDDDGVYPALLNVNGTIDGQERRVGDLATFLVREPVVPKALTSVSWLWPVSERSHRNAAGGFVDDDLTTSIEHAGRLDLILSTLERLPRTLPPGARDPVPAVPVTLAVDPALVEELSIMATGPYTVAGTHPGRGTDAARAFLQRLRALAAVLPVVALPYGDLDADALVAAGLKDVVTRSLPGTSAGTAQDPPGAAPPAPASSSTPATATSSPAAPRKDVPAAGGAGARILAAALHTTPRTDLAWPAGGSVRPATLTTLEAGGMRTVVLAATGLSAGDRAVGATGGRAVPHTSVATSTGRVDVLVADPVLSGIVGSSERAPGGPRMAEQRYLAELAVLGMQAPAGASQSVLIAPPRSVVAGPDGVGAMMADTAGLPWLRPAPVERLVTGPSAPAGTLVDPSDAVRLDPAGLSGVVRAVAVRDDLAGAVVGKAGTILQAYDAAIARACSVTWRGNAAGFRAAVQDVHDTLDRLRGKVTLLAPADGTYSLASSDAPLVLTVRNDLPFALRVRLDLRTRGNHGLSISDIGLQVLAPGQRTTLQVPTKVQQSGSFAVIAGLSTPTGGALGQPVEMQVKSTIYGSVSLLITFGAAGLLGLLFLRRLVLLVLRRRRAAAPVPETPAAIAPPTRSPV